MNISSTHEIALRREVLLPGEWPVPVVETSGREPSYFAQLIRQVWRRLRYFGLARFCPICRSHLRVLLPHGVIPRANAVCPVCFSRDRHRLVWLYLESILRVLHTPQVFLHLAPEPALARRLARRPHLLYLSGDLYHRAMFRMDIGRLPLRDGSVHFILCSHVFNMLPEETSAFRELFRVLAPGGCALIQVPNGGREETVEAGSNSTREQRLKLFGDPDMYRRYGMDFPARAGRVGFQVEVATPFQNFHAREQLRYGLIDEPFFLCRKSS